MESTLDLLVSISSIATLGQYAWSMRAHFQSPTMSQGAMIISAVVVGTALFFLALLWIERQPLAAKIGGLAIELASSALFWWAISVSRKAGLRFAFDPDNPDSLVTEGPYLHVRHPFYTSLHHLLGRMGYRDLVGLGGGAGRRHRYDLRDRGLGRRAKIFADKVGRCLRRLPHADRSVLAAFCPQPAGDAAGIGRKW
ncbi:hypothetical protein [Mesorhizobium sp. M0323]|uniref:hypothetical protein n=1 Tax=Mesorhizobium sp. M0323 TaxID=2956938 RepID=UPI00333C7324